MNAKEYIKYLLSSENYSFSLDENNLSPYQGNWNFYEHLFGSNANFLYVWIGLGLRLNGPSES
jgi:hypothetical protein